MLPGSSPMFPNFGTDASLINSILEDDSSCSADTVSHFSSSVLQDASPQNNVEDIFPDALSPDTEVNLSLETFLSESNILNVINFPLLQEETENFNLDNCVQELGYPLSIPLTP